MSEDGSYRSKPDVAIVVFGENPYSEWHGDIRSIDFRAADTLGEIDVLRPAPESPAPGAWFQPRGPGLGPAMPDPSAAAAREADVGLLQRLRQRHVPVVAVFLAGRPRGVTPEIDASNAFVVAWLPGTEGAGIADVIFRSDKGGVNFDFTGKLSFPWPRGTAYSHAAGHDGDESPLFPYGFGLSYCIRQCDTPLSAKLWRTQPSSTSQSRPGSR